MNVADPDKPLKQYKGTGRPISGKEYYDILYSVYTGNTDQELRKELVELYHGSKKWDTLASPAIDKVIDYVSSHYIPLEEHNRKIIEAGFLTDAYARIISRVYDGENIGVADKEEMARYERQLKGGK